jgi:putative ABC transport system permease protein
MSSGQFFDEQEERGGSNVVVLGSTVADELFTGTGINPLGQVIKVRSSVSPNSGGIPLRVIGVITPRGSSFFQDQDDQIFLPLALGQQQILGIRYLQAINIKVAAGQNIDQTIRDVDTTLRTRHRIKNNADVDFTVRNIADAVGALTTITDALRIFLAAMAGIALVVGGIGILNIMLATVAERTREIGLRKAIGASAAAVRNQFLLEAGTLTFCGGIIGIMVGIVISYLASLLMHSLGYDWDFVISPVSVLLAVGVSVLTGVVFGLYPAFKASKLNPIEALRYE